MWKVCVEGSVVRGGRLRQDATGRGSHHEPWGSPGLVLPSAALRLPESESSAQGSGFVISASANGTFAATLGFVRSLQHFLHAVMACHVARRGPDESPCHPRQHPST